MNPIVFAGLVAAVDRLYWAIWKARDMRVPPKDWWLQSVLSGVGGAVGGFAVIQFGQTTDLLAAVLGGFIGGRLVGGIVETVRGNK